ncbi:MAG: (deoxy)nucleoside triphosphate pyrophosphohydrolase [Candidatus Solibacter usitatus]|nr:(deoxy)nucleoside triphosphate pyrophosphohydrolase [Candidatus Solibacter usitatus]
MVMREPYRILVAAGVIEQAGRVLICQRKAGSRQGLKWEFPGGKVKTGESPRIALVRELREELGIEASVGSELARQEHAYPRGAAVQLVFFKVRSFTGEIENRIFERIVWEQLSKLPSYDFLEGDVAFVRKLAAGSPPL